MEELESQLAELVADLAKFRRSQQQNPLQHVAVELKSIELLSRIREKRGGSKEEGDGMHPVISKMLRSRAQ